MNKYLIALLIIILLIPTVALAEKNLSDIENHWGKKYIDYLVDKEIIDGYPDGTFKPNNTIGRDAFIKLTVVALGYNIGNAQGYWAQNYIDKAIELNLIASDEFEKYNVPIKREEMASIINNALNEELVDANKLEQAINEIDDYSCIDNKYKIGVLGAYAKGIITGYPDGRFRPKENASRVEASVVILRLIDPSMRQVPQDLENNTDNENTNEETTIESLLHKEHMNSDGVDMYWKVFLDRSWSEETGFKEGVEHFNEYAYGIDDFQIKEGTEYTLKFDAKEWNATEPHFLELKEDNIPELNKKVNNLMSYFVDKAVEMDKFIHIRGVSEDQENIDYLRLAFHRGFAGAVNANYIGYYFMPQTEDLSDSEYEENHSLSQNAFMMVSVHNLMPDEWSDDFYQEKYKEVLFESLIVCFGEEDAQELFNLMFKEYCKWMWDRGTYTGYGKTYYVAGYRIDVPKNPKNYLDFYLSIGK